MLFMVIFMSITENIYKFVPTLGLTLLTGIGGNMLAICGAGLHNYYYAGLNVVVIGIFGSWTGFLILNCKGLGTILIPQIKS